MFEQGGLAPGGFNFDAKLLVPYSLPLHFVFYHKCSTLINLHVTYHMLQILGSNKLVNIIQVCLNSELVEMAIDRVTNP